MIEFLILHSVLVFLITAIAVWLGSLVYFNNPKGKINKIFVLMVVSMLGWVNFAFFARLIGVDQPNLASLFLRVAWSATPLVATFLYFLVIFLLKKEKEYKFLSKIVLLTGTGVVFITAFSDFIIKGIRFVNGNLTIIYGEWMLPYLGIMFFLICVILYPLIKGYSKFSKQEKQKIEYFLVGVFIFYLGNIIFNITLPIIFNVVHLYWIGDYSTIFLLSFTAYAIVRHELFEIKVVLTSLLVGLIAILLTVDLFVFTPQLSVQILKGLALMIFLFFGRLLIKSVLREIKRREQLEQLTAQLEKANIKLQKLDKAKTEFLSIASHQLRTPLSAVKGYISMILGKTYGALPERMERPLKNINLSNERLIKLVNDILNVSRIEAGKMEIKFERLPLEEIITSVVEELKYEAKKKDIYLKWEEPEKPLPKILVDKSKIRQVIINIVKNAINYTEKGGVTIKLKIENSKLKIIVFDTGTGMTKDELAKIFKSFSRGTAGTRFFSEGTGLGLYVAKKFVEIHKGKIWAESEGKNKGSTFYIELPLKKA